MKNCRHCQSEIDEKAIFCPNCRKRQGTSRALGCLAILFFGFLGIVVISNSTADADIGEVIVSCQRAAERQLVAPSTAQWPSSLTEAENVIKTATSYIYRTPFDAQNRMGAMVRMNAVCMVSIETMQVEEIDVAER